MSEYEKYLYEMEKIRELIEDLEGEDIYDELEND